MTRPTPAQLRFLAKLRDEGPQVGHAKVQCVCDRVGWTIGDQGSAFRDRITPAGLAVLVEFGG